MSKITWVYIMLGIYIVYCFYWKLKVYFTEKTAAGYAIAGRSIPFFAFLLAATAASFSGWTFVSHPGAIYLFGPAYAFVSFYVLTIPISGTFFSKRNELMGKRFSFIIIGDVYAYSYNTEVVRWLVVTNAFLYAMFSSALQSTAVGAFFHYVTGIPCLKDDEAIFQRQNEVRKFLWDIGAPSQNGRKWRNVMKGAVP
jgi:Na+/proline symporter